VETGINTTQQHVDYLLNSLMTTTMTRHMSQPFNFSLHVKNNRIEFEDKPMMMYKVLRQNTAKGIF